jgi:RimJ/RimL family protein N-acetyltransferase
VIETERLTLRPFIGTDRKPLIEMSADPRVGRWLGGVLDEAGVDALIARVSGHIAEHGFGFWAAERKADRRFVGMIGLTVLGPDLPPAPGVEIGWRLAADAHGQGLATEGAGAALAWGFANLPLDEIVAFTARTNLASQAVMRRLGMRADPSRDFEHPRLAADHPLRSHVLYAKARP